MAPDAAPETEIPHCPKCSGDMWDNRESKRNPRAPDFKCKNRECDGVIWPPREGQAAAPQGGTAQAGAADAPACPVCGGAMWDDRASKRNPRAPDFKCKNKPKFQGGPGCPGVIWPPRDGERKAGPSAAPRTAVPRVQERPASRPPSPQSRAMPEPPPEVLAQRDFSDDEIDDDLPF